VADVLTGIVAGLKRRLDTDTLTDDDKERLELTRRLRELRTEGKTFEECGELLAQNPKTLAKFVRGGVFRLLCDHIEGLESGEDVEGCERVLRQARTDLAGLAPSAIAFLRHAYRKGEDGREYRDEGLAQWATGQVMKSTGLTEAQNTVRPVININLGVIQAELQEVGRDDMRAASAVIEVTPQAAPSENRGDSRAPVALPPSEQESV
jgi:hypothetical protein